MKFIQCSNKDCSAKMELSTDRKVGEKISEAILPCPQCGSDFDMIIKEPVEGSSLSN